MGLGPQPLLRSWCPQYTSQLLGLSDGCSWKVPHTYATAGLVAAANLEAALALERGVSTQPLDILGANQGIFKGGIRQVGALEGGT